MTLIEFLISENKKGWEWPESIVKATSTKGGRGVNFYFDYACPPSLSNTLIAPAPFSSSELVTREKYESALAASKPEWDGRGLPPSGVKFEYLSEYLRGDFGADEGRWVKCTMKYAGEKFCIVHLDGEGESWLKHAGTKIRPIRSEADKKRDDAVKALKEIIGGPGGPYAEVKAGEIYDAIKSGKIVID